MSLWTKSYEDVLFGDETALWDRYPKHVVRGFFAVSYDESMPLLQGPDQKGNWPFPRDEEEAVAEALEAFGQRWGGLSDDVFTRVQEQAQDRDRLAALFAIGHSPSSHAAKLLSPLFTSSPLLTRYAAAILLGLRHDERSLPFLEEYLLADAPC